MDAYDSATVYAYDRSEVVVQMDAAVYVASDDADVEAWGDSKVYLPAEGLVGSRAEVRVNGNAKILRGTGTPTEALN